MPIVVDDTPNPGTTLDLTGTLWLNDAADLSDLVRFEYVESLSPSVEQPGEVRMLAGGRERLVTTAGRPKSYSWSLSRVTREQIQWIEAHVGRVLCVRDDRGRKFYGTYLTAPFNESTFSHDRSTASLTLESVTHFESA